MMLFKVKPLHEKVEQTTAAIENAEHRMKVLQAKHEVQIAVNVLNISC